MKLDWRSISPRPPKRSENPSTRSRLPITEPLSEPRTTSVRPWLTASRAMISSGAFPKVALRKPPIPGPVCSAACSVASPISHASGISADGGEHELERLRRVEDVVDEDHERREPDGREEDAADHGPRTLTASPGAGRFVAARATA